MRIGSTVDCGDCRACCKGEAVYLRPGDDPRLYETTPAKNLDGAGMGLMLRQKANGDCHYLGPEGCTIYPIRPLVCRAFSCVGFVRKMKDSLSRPELRRLLRSGQITREVWEAGKARLDPKEDATGG